MDYTDIFQDKVILITGGTGFLGRALVKEILRYKPTSIRVFSRDEVKHHQLQQQMQSSENNSKIRYLVGDVRDYSRLQRALENVDIVIHAAALKRLDILEYNVAESINTNILGTLNVVNACLANNVEHAIFVSTDKACLPINTYGACKFIGEKIFTETDFSRGNKKTIFTSVRYGNVLESTGSVIPFFESKIKNGQKIPLTDPRMTRFIISEQQAIKLIFDALRYGAGGEVFIPHLPAFKIVDLIDLLAEKHEINPGVVLVGIRPGEKIHELLLNCSEVSRTYIFKDLYIVTSSIRQFSGLKVSTAVRDQGRKLNEDEIKEYSSENAVIQKEEVMALFQSMGILTEKEKNPEKINEVAAVDNS